MHILYTADDKQFRSKTVQDALEVIENRKKTIKAKLLIRKEHLLTQVNITKFITGRR